MAREEIDATNEVFTGQTNDANAHFVYVGMAKGLVRVKGLHLGRIEELAQQVKEEQLQQNINN